MKKQETTIFDLLDNFFGSEQYPIAKPLNNRQIRELREHVLNFHNSFKPFSNDEYKTRLFLGGFLSSPPFTTESSPYISSALLCSDSIVLFDPLHYWFCDEQYKRVRLLSAPTGWKNVNQGSKDYGRPDYNKTKQYLAHTFPWLYSLRPLVETGKIVLIPAEQIVFSNSEKFKAISKEVRNITKPVEKLADIFLPKEITVDDNCKGLFVFAGGSKITQIRKSIVRGIEQFAKDVTIANATNSIYTAPFRWEQYLGNASFNEYAAIKNHARIVEGIRNLRLPILANLSPHVLNEIHQDSGFSEFRKGLQEALQEIDVEIGSEEFVIRTRQIEQEILIPKVEALHAEVKSSKFKKLTNAFQEGVMTFTQTFGGNLASGVDMESNIPASAISGGVSILMEFITQRNTSSDKRIWTKLLPEKAELPIYGSSLTLKESPENINGWDIPQKPSMTVTVTSGIFKIPWDTQP